MLTSFHRFGAVELEQLWNSRMEQMHQKFRTAKFVWNGGSADRQTPPMIHRDLNDLKTDLYIISKEV